jgi:hypothetical protein
MTSQSFPDRHFQISLGIGYGVANEPVKLHWFGEDLIRLHL